MRQKRAFAWLGRLASGQRRDAGMRRLLLASRDLPPVASPALPCSPEPLSETELQFARSAASRSARPRTGLGSGSVPSIATGADLRVLLERFERVAAMTEPLEQASRARAALDPHPGADHGAMTERPTLRLVPTGPQAAGAAPSARRGDSNLELERDIAAALAAALDTLRRLSGTARR